MSDKPESPLPPNGDAPRRRSRATKLELAERLDVTEDMLRAGIAPTVVRRQLAARYGCSQDQAERYVQAVHERWRAQMQVDVPFRREKVVHMAEHHYAKAMAKEKYAPAATSLVLLARMSGALMQHDPRRAARLAELGPAPMEPGKTLQYTRRLLLLEIEDVAHNQSLDPERRLRWISELAGKLGMLYSRSEVEDLLQEVEGVLEEQRALPPATEVVDAKSVGWAEAASDQGDRRGPRAVPGPGPDAREREEPDGDDPSGGGPVG